ncbi:MAG: D-alanyl-D-alanine carboxypeptidase [Nitrospiraceae bacterium]|nr:D-alanyl-D-alanine carboxypeptidase [Nitrospiraceae bacterium]
MDSQTHRILYAKNADLKLKPASTTKLVTAMVVLDRLSPDKMVRVSKEAAYTPSIPPHLRPGDVVSVRDLLYLALMRSINGAAVALAQAVSGSESAFAVLMNQKAASLNAKETHYVNASGLPAPGQYITASDLALILDGALRYPLIRQIINTKEKDLDIDGRQVYLRNTDKLLWSDDDLIGGKTGYTRAAEHCLVFAASKGDCTLVTSLLGERERDRLWLDGKKLLEKSYLVANGEAAPEIYKSHVVLTSYEPARHHIRRHHVLRRWHRKSAVKHYRVHYRVKRRMARRHMLRNQRVKLIARHYLRHDHKRRYLHKKRYYHRKKIIVRKKKRNIAA